MVTGHFIVGLELVFLIDRPNRPIPTLYSNCLLPNPRPLDDVVVEADQTDQSLERAAKSAVERRVYKACAVFKFFRVCLARRHGLSPLRGKLVFNVTVTLDRCTYSHRFILCHSPRLYRTCLIITITNRWRDWQRRINFPCDAMYRRCLGESPHDR